VPGRRELRLIRTGEETTMDDTRDGLDKSRSEAADARRRRLSGLVVSAAGVVGVILCVALTAGATGKGVRALSASHYVVIDANGRHRAVFGRAEDGEPFWSLRDPAGKTVAVCAFKLDGRVAVALSDTKGTQRAILGLAKEGEPFLTLRDKAGKDRLAFGLKDDGTPTITMIDDKGRQRALMGLRPDGSPLMVFLDTEDKVIWGVP
jgi:hypothetical protein